MFSNLEGCGILIVEKDMNCGAFSERDGRVVLCGNCEGVGNSPNNQKQEVRNEQEKIRNAIHQKIIDEVSLIQRELKYSKAKIALGMGINKSYLYMMLNNFEKYFPKTKSNQDVILDNLFKIRNAIPNNSEILNKNQEEND